MRLSKDSDRCASFLGWSAVSSNIPIVVPDRELIIFLTPGWEQAMGRIPVPLERFLEAPRPFDLRDSHVLTMPRQVWIHIDRLPGLTDRAEQDVIYAPYPWASLCQANVTFPS